MKIEFLRNVNEYDEHVLRLYDFDSKQAKAFQDIIRQLINLGDAVDLVQFEFMESVNCTLSLQVSAEDEGIVYEGEKRFVCLLTPDEYKNIIKLIEPFCHKETRTYQWLYDLDNPIDFLFSPGDLDQTPLPPQ
jgi:hypothetical protein